jgi:(p)ppGpp synthase/HD superfamily hydrolase
MRTQDKISWCIDQHNNTNHKYSEYLPYAFHLRMVNQVYLDFKHLLPKNLISKEVEIHRNIWETIDITHNVISISTFGHDLIEDTRVSYNEVVSNLGVEAADIIYALTNEKGKTRSDRANDSYYNGIRNVKGGVFVKLCDRIANGQFSKMTKSSMFNKYKSENPNFLTKLGLIEENSVKLPSVEDLTYLQPMVEYLNNLFESE